MPRLLVACERSGIVRDAFAGVGWDAWSCDTEPSERPGQHIQDDVLAHLADGWDMMIAHPPCRYLSQACPQHWRDATKEVQEASIFAMQLWHAPIPKVALENPLGLLWRYIGRPACQIQPWWFGDPYTKRTCLWLRGLPPLFQLTGHGGIRYIPPGVRKWTAVRRAPSDRARTFPGIARAMAAQWGTEPTP
jgi:hypothetical protein